MSHPSTMNVSNDVSLRSSLNFERPNTPNTSISLSLPSTSANHARLANTSVERPVPPYSQTDTRPAFDFHAYLRDLDPGAIYVVEDLRSNPSQLITRARKHGIDPLQRWYQTQRGAQPEPFRGHRSLIIKHCPSLTSCHPETSHAVQSNPQSVEHFVLSLLGPPDVGHKLWTPNDEHPVPVLDDKPHTMLLKLFRRWKCQAKNSLQQFTSTYAIPLSKLQQMTDVQIPQSLHFDPQTATLVLSDLGNLTELASFFAPLRYFHDDSPDALRTANISRRPRILTPDEILRVGLGSEASREAYFSKIGARLGLFLANLHGHRWQQQGGDTHASAP